MRLEVEAELELGEIQVGELDPCQGRNDARRALEKLGHRKRHAGERRDVVEEKWQSRRLGRNGGATGNQGVEIARLEVARGEGGNRRRARFLRVRRQSAGVVQAIRADMDDDAEGGAARNLCPARCQVSALLEGERVAFTGAPGDEHGVQSVVEKVPGLIRYAIEVNDAGLCEGGVRGRDEAFECECVHWGSDGSLLARCHAIPIENPSRDSRPGDFVLS